MYRLQERHARLQFVKTGQIHTVSHLAYMESCLRICEMREIMQVWLRGIHSDSRRSSPIVADGRRSSPTVAEEIADGGVTNDCA